MLRRTRGAREPALQSGSLDKELGTATPVRRRQLAVGTSLPVTRFMVIRFKE